MNKKIIYFLAIVCTLWLIGCTPTTNSNEGKCKVTFLGLNGEIIEEKMVEIHSKLDYPDDPIVEGYTFIGWDKTIEIVSTHTIIQAQFEKESYKVTFIDNFNNKIEEKFYTSVEKINYPIPHLITGYHFVEWNKIITNVNEDTMIMAIYEKNEYTIIFQTCFEEVIAEKNYMHLDKVDFPVPPVIEGYEFIGWDKIINKALSSEIVTALYEKSDIDVSMTDMNIENKDSIVRINAKLNNHSLEKISNIVVKTDGKENTFPYDGNSVIDLEVSTDYLNTTYIDIEIEIELINGKRIQLYQDSYLMYIPIEFTSYTSYVDEITFEPIYGIDSYLETVDFANATSIYTFNNAIYGGFRGTNELHVYSEENYRSRNSYGYEAAINNQGLVVATGTLVDLPSKGMILSGHGTSATTLEKYIQVGDYVVYDQTNKIASIYRDGSLSRLISIRERILLAKEKITKAFSSYEALDYQSMESLYNDIVTRFNNLLMDYQDEVAITLDHLASNLHFMVIETKTVEVKAFWHYPNRITGYPEDSTEEVARLLDSVVELGINTIYINTNFNGGSIYKSAYLKQLRCANYTYEGYRDYLDCFIGEAHKRGVRVVAWSNTHVCGDGYLPSHSKSSWVMTGYHDENNQGNIYFYDITNSEVQEFLVNVYTELATIYDLDGIEYDFIRYPSSNLYSFSGVISDASQIVDYGYNQGALDLFKEIYDVSGDVKSLILTNEEVRQKWLEFKKENVTKMVTLLSTAIRKAKPNMMISAAVMTSLTGAIQTYSQDFGTWIKEGFVDNLDPMMYTGSNSFLESRINNFQKIVKDDATIVIGLSPDNSGGDAVTLSEQIKRISLDYTLGWNEFSCRNIYKNVEILEGFKIIKRDYNVTIYDSKEEIRKQYARHMLDLMTNYYQYVDSSISIDTFTKVYNLLYHDLLSIDEVENFIHMIENQEIRIKIQTEYLYIKYLIME
jgi:hypothetical protein